MPLFFFCIHHVHIDLQAKEMLKQNSRGIQVAQISEGTDCVLPKTPKIPIHSCYKQVDCLTIKLL
jgi:hypothetical protein